MKTAVTVSGGASIDDLRKLARQLGGRLEPHPTRTKTYRATGPVWTGAWLRLNSARRRTMLFFNLSEMNRL